MVGSRAKPQSRGSRVVVLKGAWVKIELGLSILKLRSDLPPTLSKREGMLTSSLSLGDDATVSAEI